MSHDLKYDAPEVFCPGCGERCDICGDRMCATWGPSPATTCGAHRHCVDCDGDNPCRDCATERREDVAGEAIRYALENEVCS